MAPPTTFAVPVEVAKHFYEGTVLLAIGIWDPSEFPEIKRLEAAGKMALAGKAPVVSGEDLLKLYSYAGLIFGYMSHPYNPRNAGKSDCELCRQVSSLIQEAKAAAKAGRRG